MVSKKHSGKADQSTLASGRSEHAQLFSVTISWGNKTNFSLCANMLGFCSDSHIYKGIVEKRMREISIMDNLNSKMQAHARVCEENKLEEKTIPIEIILRLKVQV